MKFRVGAYPKPKSEKISFFKILKDRIEDLDHKTVIDNLKLVPQNAKILGANDVSKYDEEVAAITGIKRRDLNALVDIGFLKVLGSWEFKLVFSMREILSFFERAQELKAQGATKHHS